MYSLLKKAIKKIKPSRAEKIGCLIFSEYCL